MILDKNTDASQGHREKIGARGTPELAKANRLELAFC